MFGKKVRLSSLYDARTRNYKMNPYKSMLLKNIINTIISNFRLSILTDNIYFSVNLTSFVYLHNMM